jgi:hypothetical protein
MSAAPSFRSSLGTPHDIARAEELSLVEGIARRLLGWHIPIVADGSIERTAVHEAGHALLLLDSSTVFYDARVHGDGTGGIVGYHGARLDLAVPSAGNRVAVDLGGVLAEHIVFGSCDVSSAAQDLARALERLEPDPGGLMLVPSARMTIASHEPALRALADALVARRRLSYRECLDVVRRAGMHPREAIFSPVSPLEEHTRLLRVDAEIAERRARIERLRKWARPVTVEPFETLYLDEVDDEEAERAERMQTGEARP